MKTQIKILIIEDNRIVVLDYTHRLNNNLDIDFKILTAATLEKAKELYDQNKDDLSIIVMDHDLGNGIDTVLLTQEFKKTFEGPMIANSSSLISNDKLIEAGCNQCSVSKDTCPQKIFEIIDQFKTS